MTTHTSTLLCETTDDKLVLDSTKKLWQRDSVQVSLDARPAAVRDKDDRPHQWSEMLPIFVSPGIKSGEMILLNRKRLPKDIKVACVTTAAGHNTEIAVPVAYLNEKQGGEWKDFRLNIGVRDCDSETENGIILWQPHWQLVNEAVPGAGTFRRKK